MKKRTRRSVVEATKGIIKPRGKSRPPTERELKDAAEIAIAEDVMRSLGEPWRDDRERDRHAAS